MDGDASAERRGDQIGVDRGSADPRVRSAKVMLMSIDWCESKGLTGMYGSYPRHQ